MAVVIVGFTKCGICKEVIADESELVGFSPLVANRLDPLHQFSDAAFHSACFGAHPLAPRVREIDARYRGNWRVENRICELCSGPLTDPDDLWVTGYLVDQGPLSEFNFLQIHQSCLGRWPEKDRFQQAFADAVADGRFENEYTVRYFAKALGSP